MTELPKSLAEWVESEYRRVLKQETNTPYTEAAIRLQVHEALIGAQLLHSKLLSDGMGEFNENAQLREEERLFRDGHIDQWTPMDWGRYFARWQHTQSAAAFGINEALKARIAELEDKLKFQPGTSRREQAAEGICREKHSQSPRRAPSQMGMR